jgi:TPR repeat protein
LSLAEAGSVWSIHQIAKHYDFGDGVEQDSCEAGVWYRRAIEAGSWMATVDYADYLARHEYHAECEEVLQDGVESEFVPAFFWLAWYRIKRSEASRTYREVRPLLQYASEQGHPAASFYFARHMSVGKFGFKEIPTGISMYCKHWNRIRIERDRRVAAGEI